MIMLTQGWLVLILTNSPFWVGAVAGLQGVGQVGFGLFGGVLVERLDSRKTLLFVQLLSGTLALAIGLLFLGERLDLWLILAIALLQGILQSIEMPAGNVLLYQSVGAQRLLNGMATRMMAWNVTRIVGSLIAGVLIASAGIASCYLVIAGILYTAPLFLLFLRGVERQGPRPASFWQAASEGVKYAWTSRSIRRLLVLSVLMEALGFSYHIMLPVMARDVLEVGASGLGLLSAAGGFGALVSTLVVAGLGDFRNKGTLLIVNAAGAGLLLILFAFSPWFAVSLVLVTLVSGALMAYDVTIGTLLQLLSSDEVRGRVLGLYGLTFGFTALGGFVAGGIAALLGAPVAIALGGGLIVAYVIPAIRGIRPMGQTDRPLQER